MGIKVYEINGNSKDELKQVLDDIFGGEKVTENTDANKKKSAPEGTECTEEKPAPEEKTERAEKQDEDHNPDDFITESEFLERMSGTEASIKFEDDEAKVTIKGSAPEIMYALTRLLAVYAKKMNKTLRYAEMDINVISSTAKMILNNSFYDKED